MKSTLDEKTRNELIRLQERGDKLAKDPEFVKRVEEKLSRLSPSSKRLKDEEEIMSRQSGEFTNAEGLTGPDAEATTD